MATKAIAFRDMTHNNEPLSAVMGTKVYYQDDGPFGIPKVIELDRGHYDITDTDSREIVDNLLQLGYGGCRCEVV
jgi:hypothetical protein